ncbi:hypothetical protein K435DRAFT_598643, partial [Dendrothele bispora CBS 962.96]
QVSLKFTLNIKQRLAFLLWVSVRMGSNDREPFRLIIGGPGGTGKSHLYDAIKFFYRSLKIDHEIAFTAPTGISASNIGASTTASFLSLRTPYSQLAKRNSTTVKKIITRLDSVKSLVIDKFFFLGCEDFHKISKHLNL